MSEEEKVDSCKKSMHDDSLAVESISTDSRKLTSEMSIDVAHGIKSQRNRKYKEDFETMSHESKDIKWVYDWTVSLITPRDTKRSEAILLET